MWVGDTERLRETEREQNMKICIKKDSGTEKERKVGGKEGRKEEQKKNMANILIKKRDKFLRNSYEVEL